MLFLARYWFNLFYCRCFRKQSTRVRSRFRISTLTSGHLSHKLTLYFILQNLYGFSWYLLTNPVAYCIKSTYIRRIKLQLPTLMETRGKPINLPTPHSVYGVCYWLMDPFYNLPIKSCIKGVRKISLGSVTLWNRWEAVAAMVRIVLYTFS